MEPLGDISVNKILIWKVFFETGFIVVISVLTLDMFFKASTRKFIDEREE